MKAVRPASPAGISVISGKAPREERRPDVERRLIEAVSNLCGDGTPFAEVSISRLVREARRRASRFDVELRVARLPVINRLPESSR